MHNADAFHDGDHAYPAITVMRRQNQGAALVASVGRNAGSAASGTLSTMMLAARRSEPLALPRGLRTALVDTWFKGSARGPVIRRNNWRFFVTLNSTLRHWNLATRSASEWRPAMTAFSSPKI